MQTYKQIIIQIILVKLTNKDFTRQINKETDIQTDRYGDKNIIDVHNKYRNLTVQQ